MSDVSALQLTHTARERYLSNVRSAYARRDIKEPSVYLGSDPTVEEKMWRHYAFGPPMNYRAIMAAGRDWKLVPMAEDDPKAELGVQVGTELLKRSPRFTEMRRALAKAFFYGKRFTKIHGEFRPLTIGDSTERMWWCITAFEDVSKNWYRDYIEDPSQTNPKVVKQVYPKFGTPEWQNLTDFDAGHLIEHTYQDEEEALGYGKGLRDSLYWIWYTLQHVSQESIGAIERFARGLPHMKIDQLRDATSTLPNSTIVDDTIAALEDMMARHVLVSDRADDLVIESGSMEGWQMLKDFRQELKDDATRAILNSVLPTGGGDMSVGSLARAEVEEGSTAALIQFDREALEETLEKRLLGCIWWRNQRNMRELGIEESCPALDLTTDQAEVPKEVLESAEIGQRLGLPLSKSDLYKRGNLQAPINAEDTLEPPQPAMDPFGGGGFGMGNQPPEEEEQEPEEQEPEEQEAFGAGVQQ